MRLRLDHLILRTSDPSATLAELVRRTGAPVLAPVERVGGMESGIARAGSIDLEVLRIGRRPPAEPAGYGLGLIADVPIADAVAQLRRMGLATSLPLRAVAGGEPDRRAWRAAQIHGLLPSPFPAPATRRPAGAAERLLIRAAEAINRSPALARAATALAGESMVVLTEYEFDAEAVRARAGSGPAVAAVEVGVADHREAWERLPLSGGPRLVLREDGPAGVRAVTLIPAAGDPAGRPFSIGSVAFTYADEGDASPYPVRP